MRAVDIYRGMNPPSQEFDPFENPTYQKVMKKTIEALRKLEQYSVPDAIVEEIDSLNNELSAIELELMWCFAFKKGIEFQKNLEQKTSEIDLSVRLAGLEM